MEMPSREMPWPVCMRSIARGSTLWEALRRVASSQDLCTHPTRRHCVLGLSAAMPRCSRSLSQVHLALSKALHRCRALSSSAAKTVQLDEEGVQRLVALDPALGNNGEALNGRFVFAEIIGVGAVEHMSTIEGSRIDTRNATDPAHVCPNTTYVPRNKAMAQKLLPILAEMPSVDLDKIPGSSLAAIKPHALLYHPFTTH